MEALIEDISERHPLEDHVELKHGRGQDEQGFLQEVVLVVGRLIQRFLEARTRHDGMLQDKEAQEHAVISYLIDEGFMEPASLLCTFGEGCSKHRYCWVVVYLREEVQVEVGEDKVEEEELREDRH